MSESVRQFERELQALIRRHSHESELTMTELIGVMQIEQHRLMTGLFRAEAERRDGEQKA